MKETPLLLLVGPSGCGKSTIARWLELRGGRTQLYSYTTRPKRYPNEMGHIFINEEDFCILKDLMAYTEINGYRYGATKQQVENCDIYVIDIPGVETLMKNYHGQRKILAVSIQQEQDVLRKRMEQRGDTPEQINARLEQDKLAFANMEERLVELLGRDNVLNVKRLDSLEVVSVIEAWLENVAGKE